MREFEKEVLSLLLAERFPEDQLKRIIHGAEIAEYEYTGSGYFLSIVHPEIPQETSTWDKPIFVGEADRIVCGFIAFIANGRITLECHSWGELEVPENFRSRNVHWAVRILPETL